MSGQPNGSEALGLLTPLFTEVSQHDRRAFPADDMRTTHATASVMPPLNKTPLSKATGKGAHWLTYGDKLVGVVHHRYEHVQQDHQGDDVVGAEHGGPNKFCEFMPGFHVRDVEIQQTKDRPEERLESFKEPAKNKLGVESIH